MNNLLLFFAALSTNKTPFIVSPSGTSALDF